jgi:hypothetical protein
MNEVKMILKGSGRRLPRNLPATEKKSQKKHVRIAGVLT